MVNNIGPPITIPEFTLENWRPMEPAKGPPLPSFLGIYWPWYKPEAPPTEYTCPICGATFTTQEDLDTHILSEHPEEVPEIPSGEILDITWWDGASYRLLTEPIPANTYITYRFRVKNTGNTVGAFKVGYTWYSDFMRQWYWNYSPSFNIEADTEGNIDWELISGPGTYTIAFHLFSNDNDVDSLTVTITVV